MEAPDQLQVSIGHRRDVRNPLVEMTVSPPSGDEMPVLIAELAPALRAIPTVKDIGFEALPYTMRDLHEN